MDAYATSLCMTDRARELLRPGEALVLDWHRLAVCCAGAGEASLYAMREGAAARRRGLVRLRGTAGDPPVYAARAIAPHLAGREVVFDGRGVFGVRTFASDLPGDFGLRAVFGRLPQGERS